MDIAESQQEPVVYFFCLDTVKPAGGVQKLYRQVDILNNHGIPAYIVHQIKGFRCRWFQNKTPVISISELQMKTSDYLVVPEICLSEVSSVANGIKKIVFNQGCYETFLRGYSFDKADVVMPYHDPDLLAALVVSEDSKRYLEYAFPHVPVYRIHNSIDPECFVYQEQKQKKIAYLTRKNPDDVIQVINILHLRKVLKGFELMPIDNMSQQEVADILRESLFFLSFSYPEGFSLPPAEAMACGCIVVGYHGMGGKEYFDDSFCYPVSNGDVLAFAQTVEKVIAQYEEDPLVIDEKRHRASAYIRECYSPEREIADSMHFWRNICRLGHGK